MSWLNKILGNNIQNDKYDISKKEYNELKSALKDKFGIKLTNKEKVEFNNVSQSGRIGGYLNSEVIDKTFNQTMGIAFSGNIVKSEEGTDLTEADKLLSQALVDPEVLETIKVTNPAVYARAQKVLNLNETKPLSLDAVSNLQNVSKNIEELKIENNAEKLFASSGFSKLDALLDDPGIFIPSEMV